MAYYAQRYVEAKFYGRKIYEKKVFMIILFHFSAFWFVERLLGLEKVLNACVVFFLSQKLSEGSGYFQRCRNPFQIFIASLISPNPFCFHFLSCIF